VVVVVAAVVDGFQIFSQVVLVALVVHLVVHQDLVMLDEDSHHHQAFELISELMMQVS
jgi:hypothetical protein